MAVPADRFTPVGAVPRPVAGGERSGDDWVARRVGANGVVCVSWQQVSVGKRHAGARCDVHVTDELLQCWVGNELCKTVARTSRGEVRKKRHRSRNRTDERQGSTEENPSPVNRRWTSAQLSLHGDLLVRRLGQEPPELACGEDGAAAGVTGAAGGGV